MIGRYIKAGRNPHVGLVDRSLGMIVWIDVAGTMPELFGPLIMPISEVQGDGLGSVVFHIFAGRPDRFGGGVALRSGGQVNDRLGEIELAFG